MCRIHFDNVGYCIYVSSKHGHDNTRAQKCTCLLYWKVFSVRFWVNLASHWSVLTFYFCCNCLYCIMNYKFPVDSRLLSAINARLQDQMGFSLPTPTHQWQTTLAFTPFAESLNICFVPGIRSVFSPFISDLQLNFKGKNQARFLVYVALSRVLEDLLLSCHFF